MKALIVSRRKADEASGRADSERFSSMIEAIRGGGIDGSHVQIETADELAAAIAVSPPDLVFCAAHALAGPGGREVGAHELLEKAGVPFVGSPSGTIALALSKPALKEAWAARGIRTPPWFAAYRSPGGGVELVGAPAALAFPYIVKPASEGNSRGIDGSSIARDEASLESAIARTTSRYGGAIVEAYLGGFPDAREFTVAMIGNGSRRLALPAEILFTGKGPGERIVTTEDKNSNRAVAQGVAEGALRERLSSFALAAFEAAGVRDYARCDVFLADGELWAIEINGQPMIPDRWFAACAAGGGMDKSQYLNAIFLAAIERLESVGPTGGAR